MHVLRHRAEELRSQGYSYSMISEQLGIAKGTMSYWFKDKPFTPNQYVLERVRKGPLTSGMKRHNEKVKDVEKQKRRGIKEVGRLSKRDIWMLGIGLYIGEGSKSIETIRIVNSDPAVISLAVRWFKECCNLKENNITIALHIYPDNKETECINYWIGITGLKRSNFRKTQIDNRVGKKASKRGKLPYGTAHVSIVSNGDSEKGVRLHRRITGWMSGVLTNDMI